MQAELLQLLDKLPDCHACSFGDTCRPIEFTYNESVKIILMVIIARPTEEETKLNWPFGARETKYIESLIAPIFPLQNTYLTYLAKCHSKSVLGIGNTKICRETFLDKEIMLLKPKVVLTMGSDCAKILHVPKGISVGCDKVVWINTDSPVRIFNQGSKHETKFKSLLNEALNLIYP